MDEKRYLTVSALNRYLKAKLEADRNLRTIYIKGEISNLRKHYSGIYYFTLKDEDSQLRGIMYASQARELPFDLEDGMQVLITGCINVYSNGGYYQLQAYSMELDGIGNLYLQVEKTKRKLEKEGIFDSSHKKAIPKYPHHIGVLVAKDSAAYTDIVKITNERNPLATLHMYYVPVQGKDAYKKIIEELKRADQQNYDVLILARGGGSLEDLMNFNEESLVRCIYDLKTPIITGVGHQRDYTLVDFVADLRAATPTDTAGLANTDLREVLQTIALKEDYLQSIIKVRIEVYHKSMKRFDNLPALLQHRVMKERNKYNILNQKIQYIGLNLVNNKKNQVNKNMNQIQNLVFDQLKYKRLKLNNTIDALNILSPLNTLKRGFSIVSKEHVIDDIYDLHEGDRVSIRMQNGIVEANLKEIEYGQDDIGTGNE